MKVMRGLALFFTLGLGAFRGGATPSHATSSSCEGAFFLPARETPEDLAELRADPTILRFRIVAPALDALNRDETLELNLFDGDCLRASRASLAVKSPTSLVWSGHIEGRSEARVIFVRQDSVLVGSIAVGDRRYQVRVLATGAQALVEVNPSAFPPEAEPPAPKTTTSIPS